MGLLLGIGLVAALLMMASGHSLWGHHEGGFYGMRGHMMGGSFGPGLHGPAPWLFFGLIGALLVAAVGFFPLVLMVGGGWLLFRYFATGHAPHFSAPSFKAQGPGGVPAPVEPGIFCPSCNQQVSRNWATCPHCGYRKYVAPDLIQRRCVTCGTELQKGWQACPYCSTRIDAPAMAPAPGPAHAQEEPARNGAETASTV